jgi:hypothetical protein
MGKEGRSMAEPFRLSGVKARRATDKALLVYHPDLGEVWVPQSAIDDDSEVYKAGDEGDLVVAGWLAEKRGWL